jgi:hypothetical protein
MPTGTRDQIGNEIFEQVIYVPSVTYPTLGANASGTNTITILGVQSGDQISWNLQAPPAHIFLENAYASAINTVTLSWTTDSTGITGATMGVTFSITRPENAILGLSFLPTNVT